jgi:amino acid transporter
LRKLQQKLSLSGFLICYLISCLFGFRFHQRTSSTPRKLYVKFDIILGIFACLALALVCVALPLGLYGDFDSDIFQEVGSVVLRVFGAYK